MKSIKFYNCDRHRSTGGALSTWRGRKRETGESEMNNLKRYQQHHVSRSWHLIPLVICKYVANYFKLNNFKLGQTTLSRWGETTFKLGRNDSELGRNDLFPDCDSTVCNKCDVWFRKFKSRLKGHFLEMLYSVCLWYTDDFRTSSCSVQVCYRHMIELQ